MTWQIILQIILFGIALAMDAFAVSITDGLIYQDINKKKSFFIASIFGLMQGIMPLIGFFIVEIISVVVGENGGKDAGNIMAIVVTWVAFAALLVIGGKMLLEGVEHLKKPEENEARNFSYKEVLIMGVATSIDALAVGVSLHAGLSTPSTIWLHVSIIIVITFIISLIGLFLGKKITALLKGKYQISEIIGGVILISLAIWVVASHYSGL